MRLAPVVPVLGLVLGLALAGARAGGALAAEPGLFAVPACPLIEVEAPAACRAPIPADAPDPYVAAATLCRLPAAASGGVRLAAWSCVLSRRLAAAPAPAVTLSTSFGVLVRRPGATAPALEVTGGQSRDALPWPADPGFVAATTELPIGGEALGRVADRVLVQVASARCRTVGPGPRDCQAEDRRTHTFLVPVIAPTARRP